MCFSPVAVSFSLTASVFARGSSRSGQFLVQRSLFGCRNHLIVTNKYQILLFPLEVKPGSGIIEGFVEIWSLRDHKLCCRLKTHHGLTEMIKC